MNKKNYKRVLTIQDISCVGQCSLTVALPILSACGHETCILPSAVLSTHTAGFSGFTFRDLSSDMQGIKEHWIKESIKFDAIYTGYLGSISQIDDVISISKTCLKEKNLLIVDPAMGDNGKLYPIFDLAYANKMKDLCAIADFVIPNITEACFLTGIEYKESYDMEYIKTLCKALSDLGSKVIVLTGVGFSNDTTGVCVYEKGNLLQYSHPKFEQGCHGTGDVYASAFTGALLSENSKFESAKIAADFTYNCIKYTKDDPDHWYGVKFEPLLSDLIVSIK